MRPDSAKHTREARRMLVYLVEGIANKLREKSQQYEDYEDLNISPVRVEQTQSHDIDYSGGEEDYRERRSYRLLEDYLNSGLLRKTSGYFEKVVDLDWFYIDVVHDKDNRQRLIRQILERRSECYHHFEHTVADNKRFKIDFYHTERFEGENFRESDIFENRSVSCEEHEESSREMQQLDDDSFEIVNDSCNTYHAAQRDTNSKSEPLNIPQSLSGLGSAIRNRFAAGLGLIGKSLQEVFGNR